jgi:hypothetical protein
MALDWDDVKEKYDDGGSFPSLTGSRSFRVDSVTDDEIHFRTAVSPDAVIRRDDLERAVELIEAGEMHRDPDRLLEEYKETITHSRATVTVCLLKDLGYTD